MKKLFFLLCLSVSGLTAIFAQTKPVPKTVQYTATDENLAKSAIDLRAMKTLHEQFPLTQNEMWAPIETGYLASFDVQSIRYSVFLNQQGKITSQIRTYTAGELPAMVRNLVNEMYSDFTIGSVKEITAKNKIAYLVTITNKDAWKVIRVVGEEAAVFEEHKKG